MEEWEAEKAGATARAPWAFAVRGAWWVAAALGAQGCSSDSVGSQTESIASTSEAMLSGSCSMTDVSGQPGCILSPNGWRWGWPSGTGTTQDIPEAFSWCRTYAPNATCYVLLTDGAYYENAAIVVPTNVDLLGTDRDGVQIVWWAGVTAGPMVTVGYPWGDWTDVASNAALERLTVQGALHQPTATFQNNYAVEVNRCVQCTVDQLNITGSRASALNIDTGQSLDVHDNYVHDNGDISTMRSDGITVHALEGASQINHNWLQNNTDVNLIVGGGSTGSLLVIGNTVAYQDTGNSGAAFVLAESPNWSLGLDGAGVDTSDFGATALGGNVDSCGSACNYGFAIGIHLGENWWSAFDTSWTPTYPPIRNFHLNDTQGNSFDRVTVDYMDASSSLDFTNNLQAGGFVKIATINYGNMNLGPNWAWCAGADYAQTTYDSGGRMCDWYHDR
jgi:hypothetical protein